MFLSLLTIVLLMNPRTLFAFIAASLHCLDGFALWCTMIPRSFSSSVALNFLSPISYSYPLFFLPTCMIVHLSILKSMFQSPDHLYSFSKSFLSILLSSSLFAFAQSLVSSANLDILQTMSSSMSLIYITNNNGPNTDPCGTPLVTLIQLELFPFILTRCLLSFSQLIIHWSRLP